VWPVLLEQLLLAEEPTKYQFTLLGRHGMWANPMTPELTASLTPQEWDYIAMALGERPYKEVHLLISKLRDQLEKPVVDGVTP
jgi:hypothetical protein